MALKWILAAGAEATFWALLVAFLLLRYRFGLERASVAVLVAILLDHVVILGLGVWDFAQTGGVSAYTVAILALLVYALTFGKRDVVRLDAWAKRRFSPAGRRAPAAPLSRPAARPGRPEARCAPLPPR